MKPGIELDKLIAEKVMGYNIIPHEDGPTIECEDGHQVFIPKYSEDISDAWEVAKELGISVLPRCEIHQGKRIEGYWAGKIAWEDSEDNGVLDTYAEGSFGETAPHAICLAALKTVGIELS